jgi:hypothetical protein
MRLALRERLKALVGPSACWGEADPLHQVQDLGS